MSRLPMEARGARHRFFEAEGVDELVNAVLELTTEVAVLRERQFVTERVLADQGIKLAERIEAYQPTPEESAILESQRQRLLATVLRTFGSERPAAGEQPEACADIGSNRAA